MVTTKNKGFETKEKTLQALRKWGPGSQYGAVEVRNRGKVLWFEAWAKPWGMEAKVRGCGSSWAGAILGLREAFRRLI